MNHQIKNTGIKKNNKITWFIIVTILIIATVIVGFICLLLNNKFITTQNIYQNRIIMLEKQLKQYQQQNEELKKQINESKKQDYMELLGEFETSDIYNNIYYSPTHKIALRYKIDNTKEKVVINDENNSIRLLISYPEKYQNSIDCDNNKDCTEIDGLKYHNGVGYITVYEVATNSSFEDEVVKILKKENYNPDYCNLNIEDYQFGKIVTIELREALKPTQDEINKWLKDNAHMEDIVSVEDAILGEKTNNLCSFYACGYGPCKRHFLYNGGNKMVYYSTGGMDMPDIDPSYIKFIN
ncbi:hypothetical protein KAI56_04400 [Candidatus Parcubacteria bacterium]|nr:hypothetical protein [Candidatus Parcubacteria bacterium]